MVWKALADQFQRKTLANKLELKRKLFSLRLADGGSVQDHIKAMTEVFDELTVMDDPVKEEDRVVYLLASLPERYNVLVTALEASPEVPAFAIVTERLLHEESKMKNRSADSDQEGALIGKFKKRGRCHFCNRPGHFKRECEAYAKVKGQIKKRTKAGAFKVTISAEDTNSSDGEGTGLVVQHALTGDCNLRDRWILDSGATCHMCNSASQFTNLQTLTDSLTVTLGDGHMLQATGRGDVILQMKLPHAKSQECTLHNVLFVPGLAYNLLSVTSAAKKDKITTFYDLRCEIRDTKSRLIACGHREGSLYYLDHHGVPPQVHSVREQESSRGTIWHRRFGHLGEQSLKLLVKNSMVNGLDCDYSQELDFCESCTEGKSHRSPFQSSTSKRAVQVLELVHSDVCGKIGARSLGGGEYFVTFIDDHTRYAWIYILKMRCFKGFVSGKL